MTTLIAHRGYSGKYGDNNMMSFQAAYDNGFNMIETDVQLCKTGEIVIYHDLQCNDKLVSDMSLDEVYKNGIITLDDFFNKIDPQKIAIFLDIKGDLDLSEQLYNLLVNRFLLDALQHIYISGFNRIIMENITQYVGTPFPIKLGFTTANSYTPQQCEFLFERVDFVCLCLSILNKSFIEKIKSMGKHVFTYTCNTKRDLTYASMFDVDGIVTNFHPDDFIH